jgi:hypothetical protein
MLLNNTKISKANTPPPALPPLTRRAHPPSTGPTTRPTKMPTLAPTKAPTREAVDCLVTTWSAWGDCTVGPERQNQTCITGYQLRTRNITRRAGYRGAACPPLKEWKNCTVGYYPISPAYTLAMNHAVYYYGQGVLLAFWAVVAAVSGVSVFNLLWVNKGRLNITIITWLALLISSGYRGAYYVLLGLSQYTLRIRDFSCVEVGQCQCYDDGKMSNQARFLLTHTFTVFYAALMLTYSAIFRYWFDFPIFFHVRLITLGGLNIFTKRFTLIMVAVSFVACGVVAAWDFVSFAILGLSGGVAPTLFQLTFTLYLLAVTVLPVAVYYITAAWRALLLFRDEADFQDIFQEVSGSATKRPCSEPQMTTAL